MKQTIAAVTLAQKMHLVETMVKISTSLYITLAFTCHVWNTNGENVFRFVFS
jgi:hypothetical protein